MIDRLEAIKARFDQLGIALTNPEIVGNNKKFAETSKEYRSLEKIVTAYNDYKKNCVIMLERNGKKKPAHKSWHRPFK